MQENGSDSSKSQKIIRESYMNSYQKEGNLEEGNTASVDRVVEKSLFEYHSKNRVSSALDKDHRKLINSDAVVVVFVGFLLSLIHLDFLSIFKAVGFILLIIFLEYREKQSDNKRDHSSGDQISSWISSWRWVIISLVGTIMILWMMYLHNQRS